MTSTPHSDGQELPAGAPLVSVVIPCFNQARFLSEAIASVLGQNYAPLEVTVVDDGSTDATSEVAGRCPRVNYIRQENQGLAAARNTGLRHSRGEYLVFLDADDRLLSGALDSGVVNLREHPECMLVAGRCRLVGEDGQPLPFQWTAPRDGDAYLQLLRTNAIGMHAAVMYRKTVFEQVGVFDTSLAASEDYDLYLRIARRFPICFHDHLVAEYRRHSAAMSSNAALMLRSSLRVLRSQRPYLKSDAQWRAYRQGYRFWHESYAAAAVRQLCSRMLQQGNRLSTFGELASLLWEVPTVIPATLSRAVARLRRAK